MTKKQFRVITGEGARDGQFTGDIVLLNEDGSDWTPETGAGNVAVADVDGLQAVIDDFESRIKALEDSGNDDNGDSGDGGEAA